MGWPVAKLPSGTLGLAGSCHGLFWGALQLHSAAGMPVPSRAVLGVGSSQQRRLCWARKAQSSQAKWSSLSLGDQHGCIFLGAERGHKMCVPHLAVLWKKALVSSTKPPVPSDRAGWSLPSEAQCWGMSFLCHSPVLTGWPWGWLPAPWPPSLLGSA